MHSLRTAGKAGHGVRENLDRNRIQIFVLEVEKNSITTRGVIPDEIAGACNLNALSALW